jgi:ketosteroid isomerase-like protein
MVDTTMQVDHGIQPEQPMIQRGWLYTLLLVVLSIHTASALADGVSTTRQQDVSQLFKQCYEQSVKDRSSAPLHAILDDGFTATLVVIGPHGELAIPNAKALDDYFDSVKTLIGNGTYTIDVRPEDSEVSADLATAHGTLERGIVTGQGAEYHLTNAWTAVFRKPPGGSWKLLRLHESMDGVSNPFIDIMKHDIIIRGSFIALIVGMVLGWLFRGMFLKKPAA